MRLERLTGKCGAECVHEDLEIEENHPYGFVVVDILNFGCTVEPHAVDATDADLC